MHLIDLRVSKKKKKKDHMVALIFSQPCISHRELIPIHKYVEAKKT